MVHVWSEFAFSGTHGRVPAMVGILMAHVGREFAGSRALRPHVYRREACPVHFCPQFTGPPRTGGRRVPRGRPPVLVRPEFRATVQTRGRSVPARRFPVLVGPEFTDPLQTRGRSVPTARPAPSPPARPASWTSPPDAVRSMSCISRPRARVGGTRTHTRAIMGASCNIPTTTPARTPARPPRGRVTQTPAGALDPNAGGITCQ